MAKTVGKCVACSAEMTFRYRPMEGWNVTGFICGACYSQKLLEHYIEQDRRGITKK
jgi:hypothetical protein